MTRFGKLALVARVLMVMSVVAAASGPAAQAAHPVAAQVINGATLTVLAPEVQVSLQGGALGVARDGQTLAAGDYVRTGSAGVALLTFFDGSETQLTSDTQVGLDSATRGGPIAMFQTNGTTANRVVGASRNGGFDVDSAPAAAIVRGTTFVVTVRRLQPNVGFGCGRTDLGSCVTSAVLLADPDASVGRLSLAAHASASSVDLTRACDLAGAFTTTALSQLDPTSCAQLQQSVLDLRDVAAAAITATIGLQANVAISAAVAPNQPGGPGGPGAPGGPGGPSGPGGPVGPGGPGGGTDNVQAGAFAEASGPVKFGIDQGYRNAAFMTDSGAEWERVVVSWRAAQPTRAGDFSNMTNIIPPAQLEGEIARGAKLAGLLQFTPGWAQANPDQGERSPPKNLYLPFDDPNNYWGQFVYQAALTYAGRIDEWIVWNEPEIQPTDPGAGGSNTWLGSEKDYAQLLKVAYLAIKKANPNALVSFAGTAYWFDQNAHRRQYYDRLLDQLMTDPSAASNSMFHDVVSLNIYRTADDVMRVSRVIKAIQRTHGIDKQLWLTETNSMPTDDKSIAPCDHAGDFIKTTMEQQAAFGIQAFAMAAVAGYQRVGFYAMTDDGPCTQPAVWGAVRDDGSRRPVADALKTITRAITGFTQARFVPLMREEVHWGVWPEDPASYWPNWGIYLIAFDVPGGRRVSVIWSADANPGCALITRTGAGARVLDKRGAAVPATQQDDAWAVNLPPATAHFAEDPDGYYFIGGDPELLVEDGVDPASPVSEPRAC